MELIGKKVVLRNISKKHLDYLSELECNEEIWHFEEMVESDVLKARKIYEEKINRTDSNRFDFVVTTKEDDSEEPIGLVELWSYIEHRKCWEIGFVISPEYQGKGYGKESVGLLLDFAFINLKAHKVVAMCNCYNNRSWKLMEKLGMRREGIFKEEYIWNDRWIDQYFYAILNSEYRKNIAPKDGIERLY